MEISMLKIKKLEKELTFLNTKFDDLNNQVGVLKLTIAMLEDKIDKKEEPKKRGRKSKVELSKEELKNSVRKVGKKVK